MKEILPQIIYNEQTDFKNEFKSSEYYTYILKLLLKESGYDINTYDKYNWNVILDNILPRKLTYKSTKKLTKKRTPSIFQSYDYLIYDIISYNTFPYTIIVHFNNCQEVNKTNIQSIMNSLKTSFLKTIDNSIPIIILNEFDNISNPNECLRRLNQLKHIMNGIVFINIDFNYSRNNFWIPYNEYEISYSTNQIYKSSSFLLSKYIKDNLDYNNIPLFQSIYNNTNIINTGMTVNYITTNCNTIGIDINLGYINNPLHYNYVTNHIQEFSENSIDYIINIINIIKNIKSKDIYKFKS